MAACFFIARSSTTITSIGAILKNDRARAAYDNFHPLDGKFDDNVMIQIKHGPIDFQVREPVSPLFGGLEKTNEAIELQVTQEYTGQQRHLCFLRADVEGSSRFRYAAPASTHAGEGIGGRQDFPSPVGGFVGVANVGMDANWLGHPLAMANLYGFGRLAWNPDLSVEDDRGGMDAADLWQRSRQWCRPSIGMLLASWHIYESYTGPLGAGKR